MNQVIPNKIQNIRKVAVSNPFVARCYNSWRWKLKTLLKYAGFYGGWGIVVEFNVENFWVGLYWKNGNHDIDIWLGVLPCIQIHYWSGFVI